MTTPADFSIPALQMRRGTDTAIMAYEAAEGEPIYNLDTKELRIGDGSTPGGIPLLGSSGTYVFAEITATTAVFDNITVNQTATISKINLTGIDTSTSTQVLYYNTSTKEVTYGDAPTGGGSSNPFDQDLNTTDSVEFAGLKVNSYNLSLGNSSTSSYYSVASGYGATASGDNSLALGKSATANSAYATAVGTLAQALGNFTTAIGTTARADSENDVAIGHLAGVSIGFTITNAANSIIINASGDNLTAGNSGLYVAPIRNTTSTQVLYYDATTKEITYGIAPSSGSSYDQSLNTTDNVVFKSVKTTGIVSSGGYPLDSNGQALIVAANTQSGAMVVSNYTAGNLPGLIVRGYGQNRPGGTATTNASPSISFDGARGTPASPTAVQSLDTIFALQAGGYDGTRWGLETNLMPFQLVVQARENFAGNATTCTNAGTGFFFRTQPQGIQLDATSRQMHMFQNWTAGSTTAPPIANLLFGAGIDSTTPTLINSNGANSHTGYGATNVNFINTYQRIIGVTPEDAAVFTASISGTTMTVTAVSSGVLSIGQRVYISTTNYGFITALGTGTGGTGTYTLGQSSTLSSTTLNSGPDNTTLLNTTDFTFVGGRKSGVSGRRNSIKNDDAVGRILFHGQTANSQTGNGSRTARIDVRAIEDFTGSVRGSKMQFRTVNSGTNTESPRLELKDRSNIHYSDSHQLYSADGNTQFASFADQNIVLGRPTSSAIATFNTSTITFYNGYGTQVKSEFGNTSTSFCEVGGVAGSTQYAIFNRDVHKVWSDIHILHNKAQDKQFASFENSQVVLSPNNTSVATFTTASIYVTVPINSAIQSSTGNIVTGMNAGSTTYTLISFVAATYTGGKFIIKVNDGTDLHMVEMLVITDGTNTTYNEYAVVTNNGDLGTFDATISGANVLVRFTTKAGISNASAKVNAQLITA